MTVLLFALSVLANPLGKKAPDFKLTDTQQKTHELSQYKGQIVVLEWFNPGCPFVKYAHDEELMKKRYEDLNQKKGKDGASVVWLAINSGAPGKQGAGLKNNQKAIEKWGLKYPVLLDESGEVGKLYGAKTTPQMFVVDEKGILVYAGALDNAPMGRSSETPQSHFDEALSAVLVGKEVKTPQTKPYGCSVKYAK
ncbi:MAG: thioredoxin family protein [Proteobacteria bacterium]|nr:thioredoxin family protein [Pseudomonadota bacterium]